MIDLSSKQVFDALTTTMFILGMTSVFVGISLLAPDESKGILTASFLSSKYTGDTNSNLYCQLFQVLRSKIIHL